jgi:N utilization substance protein B
MPARRKSRQRALQVLFLWDSRKATVDHAIESFYQSLYTSELNEEGDTESSLKERDTFMESLVRGTSSQFETLDRLITQRAEHWRLDRMPTVDRNILRLAIYEMKFVGTPPPVVIDEALELARRFSEQEAIPFINGVLDSVKKLILPEVSTQS